MSYTDDDYLEDTKLLMEHYRGDMAACEAERKKAFSRGIKWSDVETYAAVYPEHEQKAKDEIIRLLGYLPHANIIIPHEVFIRTLLAYKATGQMTAATYEAELTKHVQHIRNDDMRKFGWADKIRYTWAEIEAYNNYFPQMAGVAQERIERYFGALPPLDYIIPADMLLRKMLSEGHVWPDDSFTQIDYKVFTIIAYRKALIEHDPEAADASAFLPAFGSGQAFL